MIRMSPLAVVCFVAASSTVLHGQNNGPRMLSAHDKSAVAHMRALDTIVSQMLEADMLRVARTERDPLVPSRQHERLQQTHRGVRVWGGDVTRQTESGRLISLFGRVYENIDIETKAQLSADAARNVIQKIAGSESGRTPQLFVLPLADNSYRLTWSLRVVNSSMRRVLYFVDASTGELVFSIDETTTQAAVGTGVGVNGDGKKVSAHAATGTYLANDQLRPPALTTYDMRGNAGATVQVLNGVRPLFVSDMASDSDNNWQDGAVVDAHAFAGFTYDYFFKTHGRRGLDNADSQIVSIVHPARRENVLQYSPQIQNAFFLNAGYWGDGLMLYGVGIPTNFRLGGQWVDHLAGALDIVAHELTHGVTDFSSGLIYQGESGALNESFSDMMGTAVEFAYQPRGTARGQADYLIGEDAFIPGGGRSMNNPSGYGDPDHYSIRYTGSGDNGGVHINSAIPNQAFYLAIEGGTNRTSGMSVQGVGFENREHIEKVMYRAFVFMLPSNATFATARAATIQAARDLYGDGSTTERAITQAWTAVGVN